MNYLILLRHGQSQWNFENRFTGWEDVPLTKIGEDEAKNAGLVMKKNDIKIDIIFSSILKRANKTAEFALKEMNHDKLWINNSLVMSCDARLNERDYGDLVGLNKDETVKKYGEDQVHIWRRSYDTKPPRGESLKNVVERVSPYFKKQIYPYIYAGKNILMVAHGNSLRATMIEIGLYKSTEISKIEIPTGSPFLIEYEKGNLLNSRFLS